MSQTDFERFKEEKESQIGQCLRGRLGEEDGPDMPSIDSADSLKEQYYWFMLGINNPPEKDNIDWEGLEKELRALTPMKFLKSGFSASGLKIGQRPLGRGGCNFDRPITPQTKSPQHNAEGFFYEGY